MSCEENKAIAQSCFDAINRQDTTAMAEVLSPKWAAEMVAEGDSVWCRLRTNAMSRCEWLGLPPNGNAWSNTGICFLRIDEGPIIEIEWLFDELNLVRQLGGKVVPAADRVA